MSEHEEEFDPDWINKLLLNELKKYPDNKKMQAEVLCQWLCYSLREQPEDAWGILRAAATVLDELEGRL